MKKLFVIVTFSLLTSCLKAQEVRGFMQIYGATAAPLDTIQVNLYDSAVVATPTRGKFTSAAPNLWNQWSIDVTNGTTAALYSANFYTKSGTITGVRAKWPWGGSGTFGYSDNGAGYGAASVANSTIFPDSAFWSGAFRASTPTTFTISGLDDTKLYKVEVLVSRNNATSRPVTYTYGAASGSVDAALNKSTTIVLDNLSPSGGDIAISVSYTNAFSYNNAFIIYRKN